MSLSALRVWSECCLAINDHAADTRAEHVSMFWSYVKPIQALLIVGSMCSDLCSLVVWQVQKLLLGDLVEVCDLHACVVELLCDQEACSLLVFENS